MRKTFVWFTMLLCLAVGTVGAQVPEPSILVNRDDVNVRLFPAIGAEVLGFVPAGYRAPATGRSGDNQWIRIDFNGEEGWVGFPVINLFGDINSLPVADPRSIPFGGFESPRAGTTSASSPVSGRLATSGLRVRAGPSQAYPVLANAPRYTVFPLLGRTANNAWLQVNFEGTLGWVTTPFVEIQNNGTILNLPINGIVADSLPISEDSADNYVATLRLMLARIDLAQPSLDQMRSTWTSIALGDLVDCGNYPPRPTQINIANPILAANYPTLEPLRTLFNDAMLNVHYAVDLWIETCSRPQPARGVVGQATVSGALGIVNLADQQFAELRGRLNELIPPDIVLGPDDCLFTYLGASEVLKVIPVGQIIRGVLSPDKTVTGYCFDATAGQSLRFEAVQVSGSATLRLSVSFFDNPTAFIGTGLALSEGTLSVGPLIITTSGRYLLIVSHDNPTLGEPITSDFGLLISDVTGRVITGPGLILDATTGEPTQVDPTFVPVITPLAVTATPGQTTAVICPSLTATCDMLTSCAEALACYNLGLTRLDEDADGVPCDLLCGG